jgi:hypothetical protein
VVHAGYIAQLSLVDNTEARVMPGGCTVPYKQLISCTQSVQFFSARPEPILQKKIRIYIISKTLLTPGSSVQVTQTGVLLPRTKAQA